MDVPNLRLSSTAFADGDTIPEKYTCKGINVSPPLTISGVPEDTVSLALILHDPDAPNGDFLHWSVWNIGPEIRSLNENEIPDDAYQGINDFGQPKYGGPCPPPGSHRYVFELYALDSEIDLLDGASREELEEALNDHIITQTALTGIFGTD